MAFSLFAPLAPILWAIAASLIWWRQVSSPWLFLVTGVLAALGVQVMVSFLWSYWPLLFGNYFLEANSSVLGKPLSEAELSRIASEQGRVAAIQAALCLATAVPLLWWLKSALAVK